jgi:hypothetical protein
MRSRIHANRALSDRALIAAHATASGYRLRFLPEFEADLKRLIAAESECCSFVDFALSRVEGEIVLEADAPEAGRSAIAAMFGLEDDAAD